ncbi:ricin-type beta-trefoil lectin domain protein, partial [Streptomyces sp. NPDC058157]|uniref:ricin-type beta-trefoil lectin domain protein n=1 Tax=Streptomyces sp. NPDC058157 TaxID=3346360 RepID=UPI0036E6B2E2
GSDGLVELAGCAPGRRAGQSWRHRRDGSLVEEASGACLTAGAAAERLRLAACGDHRADQAWSLPA